MFLNITKKNLLSIVSEYDIYKYYINEQNLDKLIISPLRPKEKNPSFSIYKNKSNELRFMDFTTGVGGDCFDFVREYYKQGGVVMSFGQVLCQIVIDLNLQNNYIDIGKPVFEKNSKVFKKEENKPIFNKIEHKEINVKIRSWKKHDLEYWRQFGISLQTLKKFNVFPISLFYIDGEMHVADIHSYCYLELKNKKFYYKIYQPFNKKIKWVGNFNNEIIQGFRQLPETGDFLIITKSLKDVMSLYETAKIHSISFNSERIIPSEEIIVNLKSRFKKIIILYDNDFEKSENHGLKFAQNLSDKTNIPYIYFDEKYGVKDYSEAYNFYDDEAINILYEILLCQDVVEIKEKN